VRESKESRLSVIAAFDEEQAAHLAGLSQDQLRYLDHARLLPPALVTEDRRAALSRIYFFRDILCLRILKALRSQYRIPIGMLRRIIDSLRDLPSDDWKLYELLVLKNGQALLRRVDAGRCQEPSSDHPGLMEISGRIALGTVPEGVMRDLARLQKRGPGEIGRLEQSSAILHGEPVIAGTRIPVSAIQEFAAAGYGIEQILEEYPALTEKDIEAAITS